MTHKDGPLMTPPQTKHSPSTSPVPRSHIHSFIGIHLPLIRHHPLYLQHKQRSISANNLPSMNNVCLRAVVGRDAAGQAVSTGAGAEPGTAPDRGRAGAAAAGSRTSPPPSAHVVLYRCTAAHNSGTRRPILPAARPRISAPFGDTSGARRPSRRPPGARPPADAL